MTIPDFQSIMLPMLELMSDKKERSMQEILACMNDHYQLTENEQNEMLSSGKQTTFYNRVGWARTYLSKSGLLVMTRRSHYQITPRGLKALMDKPARIDMRFLTRYPEYIEFRDFKRKGTDSSSVATKSRTDQQDDERTPEEILEDAYQEIREDLAVELIGQVKNCSPAFFERLVVELLVKMGYGGSRREAARAVGQTGDGGIDGIIDEDRLGLDAIYIQAKRWEGSVGRPEIQKFVGALMGQKAKKGIFLTSSSFSSEAIDYVSNIDYKIVLIDGKRLAELMIDYDIGVTEVTSYRLKRIDSDYFING
jgi:restriction system protein